jgi:membrane fusion protein, multidrug efflux system
MSSAQLSEQEPPTVAATPQKSLEPAEPEQPKGSIGRTLLILVVLLVVVAAAVWKIRKNRSEQDADAARQIAALDQPIPVQTAAVASKTMPIYMSALGTVTAYNTVTIKSRVDGQLMRVNVREGQAVHQGQNLVEIDPKPYQAALAQAQGQLTKDQANADNAHAEAERYTALLHAGVVSKESQQAQISASGQASGSLDADRAAIEAARVNLAYTKIASPIDGVVGLRQVDPGNIVHATDTTGLLVVTQLQPIAVIFTLPEDQLPQVQALIRQGRTLVVDAYDRANATHLATGQLLTIDNQIDTTTGTAKLKAVFDNRDSALFPNQFVNIRLILEQRPRALVIPTPALQSGSQGSFVYIVKPGNPPDYTPVPDAPVSTLPPYFVEPRPVTVDLTEGSQVILKGGVQSGEQIVVDGAERLKPGGRVVLRDPSKAVAGQHS